MLKNISKINPDFTFTFCLIVLSLVFSQTSLAAGNVQLVTYYPAPMGAYDRLALIPQASLPVSCDIGALITEQATRKIYYCHNVSGVGTWGPLSNVWTTSGNYVFPTQTDTKPLIFASIGTSTPSFKLTLDNDGGILATGTLGSGVVTSYPSQAVNQSAPAQARFIWYPRKAAFRAIWDRWGVTDDTQLGNYSVGFGDTPTVTGTASTASGLFNIVNGNYGTIAGGKNNSVTGDYSTITGGQSNSVTGQYSVISGSSNQANGDYNTIGGGQNNISNGLGETIGGGLSNTIAINSTFSTISGGELNVVNGKNYAVISGGYQNTVSGNYATVVGGKSNTANGDYSFIGGGNGNTANGTYSVVGGGDSNTATGNYSVITGGHSNVTTKNYATVLGGDTNTASGVSSIIASGSNNTVTGNYSVIAGGDHNTVAGDYSWADGRYMNLTNTAARTFVWGHSDTAVNITAANAFILAPGTNGTNTLNPKLGINETSPSAILSISLPQGSTKDFLAITSANGAAIVGNIFIVKNNGYVGIGNASPQYPLQIGNISGSMGPQGILTVGGVWATPSSRKFKDNIVPLTTQKALETFQKLNPVTYNYKIDKRENHVGFIAEDVPDLVAEQGRKGLNAMPVTAVLTAVLKKQKQDLEQGQIELNMLKDELRNIDNQFNKKLKN